MNEKSKPVATRLTNNQLAKARDGLIVKGIDGKDILTKSQILRLSVFLAITACSDPDTKPSDESLTVIKGA